jgi:hypothetical protein
MPFRSALATVPLLVVAAAVAASPAASLKDVLRRASHWVDGFAGKAIYVVSDEHYDQEYRDEDGTIFRRSLVSEVALTRTAPPGEATTFPWAEFRDVIEVDGKKLPNHEGRLAALFGHASDSSGADARTIIEESARYNLGPLVRTVNVPSFALFFLTAQNQHRFRFRLEGEQYLDEIATAVVDYSEHDRPTLVRAPGGLGDRPVEGRIWIEPSSGRVLRTRLVADQGSGWTAQVEVDYGQDGKTGLWVPLAMREDYRGDRGASIRALARYSNFRRFRTDARLILR